MAQLRQDYQKFLDRGAEIIAIGPEETKAFAEWWHKEQMPFVGIGDHGHVIADAYGQQVIRLKLGRMPAMFVIDKKGRVRYRHYGTSMSDIPLDDDILSLLDELNQEDQTT